MHDLRPPRTSARQARRGQKHYTVLVAHISPEDRAAWSPQLNEEHSAWRWFSLAGGTTAEQQVVRWQRPSYGFWL